MTKYEKELTAVLSFIVKEALKSKAKKRKRPISVHVARPITTFGRK